MKRTYFKFMNFYILFILNISFCFAQEILWEIGSNDNSSAEFALGPNDYQNFLADDFGYEDKYFLIGFSETKNDFPYVLPGPDNTWGGTWSTAGWRTHDVNILFLLEDIRPNESCRFILDLVDLNSERAVVKIKINSIEKKFYLSGNSDDVLEGNTQNAKEQILEFNISSNDLKKGGNNITISVLEGGWIVFDHLYFEGPNNFSLQTDHGEVFIRDINPADYQIEVENGSFQPLLVDVEHLKGNPLLEVKLDGEKIYERILDSARYIFEVPMPAVSDKIVSEYSVYINGLLKEKDSVVRSPQETQTLADYVDTKIGTAHSRWMIAPGPWMPFSMVKLSPDNQNKGWQSGYQPTFETIGCFSHIHEWTMAGLGMMPTNGKLFTDVGDQFKPDEGYRSRIDKTKEEAPLGYYKTYLSDTRIWAELTATERASFQRYTFPKSEDGRIMIDLHIQAEYDYSLLEVYIKKIDDYRVEGFSHQISPRVWSKDADQEYTVHFVIEFDAPIKNVGGWKNDELVDSGELSGTNLKEAGMFVEFDTKKNPVIQLRTGISFVSIENAGLNLQTEISDRFGWEFNEVVKYQKNEWNKILDRIKIYTDDRREKIRFYTNLYRSFSRNLNSDVNGEWISADMKLQKFQDTTHRALGCDAFWNTFWNLNQLWNLITPEWSSKWVNSQLAMYDANGWLGKGPAGMKYIPVMVAEHEIPLIVSTYQMGIRDYDVMKAFQAIKKMQTTPATHVAGGFAGNRDLIPYLDYQYVPFEKGRFSNTLEYSFDDWTVGQFAKSLGKYTDYTIFSQRGEYWKNAINPENGYAHLRDTTGRYIEDFDPFRTGNNKHYVEGNAWQLTYFVPQNIPDLVEIVGEEEFVSRLNWGFGASEDWRYNAPNDQYWDYPVVQGNQQSMHFPFLFNWANKPWLTQKWTRSVIEKFYGHGIANAYLGDEDQGQLSSWFILASIGLFQMDGGCRVDPIYEIASPLYERIEIDLGGRYGRGEKFIIEAKNSSRKNIYVQNAILNGKTLDSFFFEASELLGGGHLILEMGDKPNFDWGLY